MGFTGSSGGKESACNAGDPGSIPGLGRSPTSVFLPGDSHRQRSLAGYNPGGCKESDMTEEVTQNHSRPSCQSHHEAHGGVCSEISDFHSRRMGTTQAVEDPDPRQEPRPS